MKLEDIAALTPGFTGADLANLANEAAVLATRRGADAIAMEDFTGAVERIVAGLEKRSRILIPKERRIVAYHEMGHALVALAIPGTDPVQKVSIIPRGIGALGYTLQRPTDDRFLMSRQELDDKMTRAAGRARGGDDPRRRRFHRRGRRSGEGDRHRARHRAAVRHGREAGTGRVGHRAGQPVPGAAAGRILAAAAASAKKPRRKSTKRCGHIWKTGFSGRWGSCERTAPALDEGAAALLAHETLTGSEIPRPKPVALAAE